MKKIKMKIRHDRVKNDALIVFDIITQGGVTIIPFDVAYAVIGYTENAIQKIFSAEKEGSINEVECSHRSIGLLHFIT